MEGKPISVHVHPFRVDQDAPDLIRGLLTVLGEDITRGGLQETPARVTRMWTAMTSGYGVEPADVLKVFEDGGESYDEMVLQKNIPFYSHCEHHMVPFFGVAHIAYVPAGKIVGLSKLSRLLEIYAHRLQVQERMTAQVVDAIMAHLQPRGAACLISARHLCMEMRGIQKQGTYTETTALRGVFMSQPETRAEFLSRIR